MGTELSITNAVAHHLDRLARLCDTGFALAVHIRYTRPTLLYRTYNQAWIDHYTERGFMLTDPVVHWGLTHTGAVNWSDLSDQDPEGVLTSALENGLLNGLTYATGAVTSRTISGHTRQAGPFTTAETAELAAIVDDVHRLTDNFETLPLAEQDGLRALSLR